MAKLNHKLDVADYYRKLTPKEVKLLIGCKANSTLWDYVKLGLIPEPHYPRPRKPLWRLGEVLECFESKLKPMSEMSTGIGAVTEQEKQREQNYLDKLKERFGIS